MSAYFGTAFEVAKDPNDILRVRLSIRSSECRVDEYSLSTGDLDFLISNQGSFTWVGNGDVSIKYLPTTNDVHLRFTVSPHSAVVYVTPLSSFQILSGQYLDAMRG